MGGAILMNQDTSALYHRAVIGPEGEAATIRNFDFTHDVEAAHFAEERSPIDHPAKFTRDAAPGGQRRIRHFGGMPGGLGNPALLMHLRSAGPRAPCDPEGRVRHCPSC